MFCTCFCNPCSMDDVVLRYGSPQRRLLIRAVIWLVLCLLSVEFFCQLPGNSFTLGTCGGQHALTALSVPAAGDWRLVTDENKMHGIFWSLSMAIGNVISYLQGLTCRVWGSIGSSYWWDSAHWSSHLNEDCLFQQKSPAYLSSSRFKHEMISLSWGVNTSICKNI